MNNLNLKFIQQISPELSLQQINEIPVIALSHKTGTALISLQGAHLLQWQPRHTGKSVFWLSELEAFKLGSAIRGGVPICYPWFGQAGTPAHGWARINLWQLVNFSINAEKAQLEFAIFANNIAQAHMTMEFSDKCRLELTHLAEKPAQAALHSYFNIADITQTEIAGLPTVCADRLTDKYVAVPSPRVIGENVDCIYHIDKSAVNFVKDLAGKRNIKIEHQNASNIVLWNPWHREMADMSKTGYQTMVCVETARINQLLVQGEKLGVTIEVE